MEKDIYWNIVDAKKAHRKWVSYAQLLIERGEINEQMVPTNETACQFGKWYYSDGQALIHIDRFKQIGRIHQQLHAKYSEIFNLLFKPDHSTLLNKLLGLRTKVKEQDLMAAREKLKQLNAISQLLTDEIDLLLIEVKATATA